MSRVPLRITDPVLQQAQAQLNVDRAAYHAARTTWSIDKNNWERLLCDPNAAHAAINAAQQAYRQSTVNYDNARLAYSQSVDALGTVQDQRDLRND